MRAVLNIGGSSKAIPIPFSYANWKHDLLDIDPSGKPDVVMDARELLRLPAESYDAVYCSHNLEQYCWHEVAKVVEGFRHVIKPDGWAEIRVPDVEAVMRHMVKSNLDLDDVLYQSPAGPILVRDVLWGWHVEIERSGSDFYIHKTGFTRKSLEGVFKRANFAGGLIGSHAAFEITGYFFKKPPTAQQIELLQAKPPASPQPQPLA